MAGRASIVGAAETSVGKVREHNEDAHFIDPDLGIFAVCDGMGGHAAGEVASSIAIQVVRENWASELTMKAADVWLERGTIEAKKALLAVINAGVCAAHDAIVAEATRDRTKGGMGTTIVGALVIGGDIVFAQSGDSRAYMVRDGIAMQLTEDHTLLARLLAAGVDVDPSNEGSRFKSMLTNALGIGTECKTATFVVPLADGDRFLLCSDGITEYVQEAEIGEVLTGQPSPARAAQKLVELALQRGGGDNATALVIRVLEAGETARPAEQLHRENKAINACPLWAKVTPQGRLRALRIALPRDHAAETKLPAQTLNDRVAWIIVDGEVEQDGVLRGPGSLLYPEALLKEAQLPDKDGLAIAQSEVRALALRCDDFHEVCEDDAELGEILLAALAAEIATRKTRPPIIAPRMVIGEASAGLENAPTDPNMKAVMPVRRTEPSHPPSLAAVLPSVPKVQSPGLMRKVTPASGKPTQPMGVGGFATSPTLPPPTARDTAPLGSSGLAITGREVTQPPPSVDLATARADTIPDADLPAALSPRTSTKDGPTIAPRAPIRGGAAAERLLVSSEGATAVSAQLDRAIDGLDGLSDEPRDTSKGMRPLARSPAPLPLPAPTEDEHDSEVVIEADEPPERSGLRSSVAVKKARGLGDNSEPEISIERFVELEVEQPMNEDRNDQSAPEIMILTPGRAITADDTHLVAGSIDTNTRRSTTKRGDSQEDTQDGETKKGR
ncbi:MAG: protein phosphatase 2C domain-containing protein [Kofleriaceae bacterium]